MGKYRLLRALVVTAVLAMTSLTPAAAQSALWKTYFNDGVALRQADKPVEALKMLKLALNEVNSPKGGSRLAQTQNQLGLVYQDMDKYSQSETILEKASAWASRQTDRDGKSFYSAVLNNLSITYEQLGRYKEAETVLRKGITISEKLYPYRNPRLATYLNNLGNIYTAQKNWTQAEAVYKRAILIHEKYDGPDDTSTAVPLANLAGMYSDSFRSRKAEPLRWRVLKIYVAEYGWDHVRTKAAQWALANVLRKTDQIDVANFVRNMPESLADADEPENTDDFSFEPSSY